jgi:hypothetical protein
MSSHIVIFQRLENATSLTAQEEKKQDKEEKEG